MLARPSGAISGSASLQRTLQHVDRPSSRATAGFVFSCVVFVGLFLGNVWNGEVTTWRLVVFFFFVRLPREQHRLQDITGPNKNEPYEINYQKIRSHAKMSFIHAGRGFIFILYLT